MFFSKKFITGLETKSISFQNKFYGIMEWFHKFFEYDEEKTKELDKYIESQISYYDKGNLLHYVRFTIGGKIDATREKEYFVEIVKEFKQLFLFPKDTGIDVATNIIITVNAPECMSENIVALIKMNVRALKPDSTPEIKVYVKHDEDHCFDCYIAFMR